jgi:hypothetical protein
MKINWSLLGLAILVFSLAFIDEVFPHIYHLPPVVIGNVRFPVIYLVRTWAAIIQWLIILIYFEDMPVLFKRYLSIIFVSLIAAHFVALYINVTLNRSDLSVFYFQLLHKMVKIVSSGLLFLGLYLLLKKGLIYVVQSNGKFINVSDAHITSVKLGNRSHWILLFIFYLVAWLFSLAHFAIGSVVFLVLFILVLVTQRFGWIMKFLVLIVLLECGMLMLYYHLSFNLSYLL